MNNIHGDVDNVPVVFLQHGFADSADAWIVHD